MTSVKLEGFAELEQKLASLSKSTAKNVLRRVAKRALEPMRATAAEMAPKDTGGLAESITVQEIKAKRISRTQYESKNGVEFIVGPAPKGVLKRSNAGWQEHGTVKMPADPYMRPAYEVEKMNAMNIVRDDLATEVNKAVDRAAKRAAKKAAAEG